VRHEFLPILPQQLDVSPVLTRCQVFGSQQSQPLLGYVDLTLSLSLLILDCLRHGGLAEVDYAHGDGVGEAVQGVLCFRDLLVQLGLARLLSRRNRLFVPEKGVEVNIGSKQPLSQQFYQTQGC
jgi:hypothetical protein